MAYVKRPQFTSNRAKSAVNNAPIEGQQEKRISNPVYRDCAIAGFKRRLAAEVAGDVPAEVPLHSHHATRQSYFARGWHAVTPIHIIKAKAKAEVEAKAALAQSPQETH